MKKYSPYFYAGIPLAVYFIMRFYYGSVAALNEEMKLHWHYYACYIVVGILITISVYCAFFLEKRSRIIISAIWSIVIIILYGFIFLGIRIIPFSFLYRYILCIDIVIPFTILGVYLGVLVLSLSLNRKNS